MWPSYRLVDQLPKILYVRHDTHSLEKPVPIGDDLENERL